jgi:hypothetical protein
MLKMLYKTYTLVERDGMCRCNTVLRDIPIRSRLKKNTPHCDDIIMGAQNFFEKYLF